MIVVVTGSRDFKGRSLVRSRLRALFKDEAGELWLRVGDCPSGADLYAREWGQQDGLPMLEVFEADWALWRATGGREGGGPARNAAMTASEPRADRCLAFYAPPPAGNRGTSGCVALARDAGIEVFEYCRTRPWVEVLPGDLVRGGDGNAWTAEAVRGGPGVLELSYAGRTVSARPKPGATVEVVARGPMGRAADMMDHAGLRPERVDTGR